MTCAYCNRWGSTCAVATCLGCGTSQCFSNGGASGSCSVCHYGILPGWSGSDGNCSYAGCKNKGAFAYVRGKRYVCLEHAKRAKIREESLSDYAARMAKSPPGYANLREVKP